MIAANPLVALLELQDYAHKSSSTAELAFVMVNDTRALVDYRQAILFIDGKVRAVSGVTAPEATAPFTLWLDREFAGFKADGARPVDAASLAGDAGSEWAEWLPPYGAWVPLRGAAGQTIGALLFARDESWSDAEITLLDRAAGIFGFVWTALYRPARFAGWISLACGASWKKLALAAAALLALSFPVRLSVLTPAEIVARAPAVVRAPVDGVVDRVHVRPNQSVTEGQILAELDRTTLQGRHKVAHKALTTAQAEFNQATQQSFFDVKAKGQVAVIKARIDERAADLALVDDQLSRSLLRAPRDGVAILDDPSEWIGRPISVGERIIAVADPADVEVEAWLAPADVIALEPGDLLTLFLNTDPLNPISANLTYITYEAVLRPDGLLAHRARALIPEAETRPRLGLKGTARLDGERVPLIYWLLRRPLSTIRQFVGL